MANKYITLSEAVKTDAGAKEDLISTQAELLEKLGLEGESIDDLIEKYGSLSNAIKQASIDSLKNSQLDLIAGVNAAKDELLDIGADGFFGGNNIINATGDDAVKAFKELEKAGVVSSGSYGSGGGSLVLIGDDTTTEGILENYQKLEDALNALRDSNAFVGGELTDNSLFQAIYARYDEMKEKVDAYKTSIGDLNENLAQQTMLTALQGSELPKSEQEFETFKQQLIDTAVASKQFIGSEKEIADSINSYLSKVPEFAEYFSLPLEDGAKNLDKMTVSIGDLEKASDNIKTLGSAFKELSDDGYITTKTLGEIKEATGLNDEAFEEYKNALLNAKAGSAEFNQIMSELTYKILENAHGTEWLATATEDEIAAILRENGVLNDEEVAHEASTRAKAEASAANFEFSESVDENAKKLKSEADACGLTVEAYVKLIAQEILFNQNQLDVSGKITALENLAKAAGLAADEIRSVLMFDSIQKAYEAETYGIEAAYRAGRITKEERDARKSQILSDISSSLFGNYKSSVDVDYSGALSDKSGKTRAEADQEYAEAVQDAYDSALEAKEKYAETVADINEDLAEKEKQFAEDMAEAWEKEHLEQLKDNLEKQKDIINKYKENIDVTDFGLDFVGENDFLNRSELLSTKVEDLTNYGVELRKEFERVAAIIPQTGEEAQALADRLTELGDEMRSNISNLRETKTAIAMLRIDAYTAIAEDGIEGLQQELDNIDRRLEILNADDKDDFKYTRKFLNMTSLLPSNGSFEAERREKQRNDRELIALERETQNQINEVISQALEMQARENAEAREKERQNLIKDMEKARQDAAKKMADAQKDLQKNLEEAGKKIKKATDDYKKELGNAEAATSEFIQSVEQMISEMNIEVPVPDDTKLKQKIAEIRDNLTGLKSEIDSVGGTSSTTIGGTSGTPKLSGGSGGTAGESAGKRLVNAAMQYKGMDNSSGKFPGGKNLWCAGFISEVAKEAGISGIPHTASVQSMYDYFSTNGKLSQVPSVGAIAMYDWKNTSGTFNHIGIVTGWDDNYIYTVEGNTTGGVVAERKRARNSGEILGFGIYATGTSFHPGGLAMVGDENWLKGWKTPSPELAVYPNGSSEIVGKNGVEIRDLPRGTKVLPADQTKDVLSGIPHYAEGIGFLDVEHLLESLRNWSQSAMTDAQTELGKAQLRGKAFDPSEFLAKYSWTTTFNGSQLAINGYSSLQEIIKLLETLVSNGVAELESFDDMINLASSFAADSPYKGMKEQKAEFEKQARESGVPVAIDDTAIKDYLWGEFFKSLTEKDGILYDDFDVLKNIDNYRVGGLHGANAEILNYYKSLQDKGIGVQKQVEETKIAYGDAWNQALMAVGKGSKTMNDLVSDLLNPNSELGGAFNAYTEALESRDGAYYTLAEEWKNRDLIAAQAIEKENEELNSLISNSSKTPLVLGGGENSDYLDFVKELQPHRRDEFLRSAFTEGESFDGLSMSPDIIGDYMEAMTELAEMSGDTLPVWQGWQRVAISNETGNIIPWDEWDVRIEHPGAMSRTFMPIEGYEGKYGLEGSNMFITKDGQIVQRGLFATTFFDKDDYTTAKVVPNSEATELIPESIRDLVLAVSTYEEAANAYLADRDKQQAETTYGTSNTDKPKRDPRLDDIDNLYAEYMKDFSALKNGLGKAQTAIDESDYTDKQKSYLFYGLAESGKYDALELSLRAAADLTKAKEEYMAEMGDEYDIEVLEAYDEAISKIGSSIYDLEADAAERKDKLKAEVTEDIDFYISKLSSLHSLTQAHFDTTNSIEEARHQINKELEASKRMYEYLDEDTRKLLFNQKDYNILTAELNSLQKETERLQRDYNRDILSATEEELDGITNQYQRQYDLVMKKYEIVKAEIEVEKKRQQLDNVLNEKNVQMLIDGEWKWVANTQDVINAQNELADAEFAAQQARTGMSQTQNLNEFSLAQDNLNILIKKIDSGVIDIFNEDVTAISDSLKDINNYDIPVIHDIMMGVAGSMVGFVETINTVLPVMGSLQGLLESGKLDEAESNYLSEMLGSEYKDGKWLHREYVPDNNAWQKIEPTDSAIRLNGMLIPKESTGIRINGQVYTKLNSDTIPQFTTLEAKDFQKSVNTFYPSIPDNMVRASNNKTYQINIDTVSLQKLDDPNRFVRELISIAENTRF